jgi:hypothetical protein
MLSRKKGLDGCLLILILNKLVCVKTNHIYYGGEVYECFAHDIEFFKARENTAKGF